MKTIAKTLLFITFLFMVFLLTSCSDETTKPEGNDVGSANVIARQGFDLMNDEADRLSNVEDIASEDDLMLQSKFDEIEGKFQQALGQDADNPMANLGMSMLEILRMNYNPEFWNLQNDMQDFGNINKSLLNNQLGYLSSVPVLLLKQYTMDSKSALSIKRFQDFVINSVNPSLESSLSYLNSAVNLADSSAILIDTGEEFVEIDCGEIYAFRASIKVLNAAFYMLTAYNWDLIGSDGTYNWIDEVNADYAPANFSHDNARIAPVVENQVLTVHYWDAWSRDDYSAPYRAEVAAKTLKYNLANNTNFGVLNQTRLTNAKNNILSAIADLRSGIDYIEHETDPQENDVIKLQYITDMNEEFSNPDPDSPAFMQEWNDVNDAIDWLESLISGGDYEFSGGDIETPITINLSAFFNGAVPDIKAVKPYLHWNEAASWVEPYSDMDTYNYTDWSVWYNNEWLHYNNLVSEEIYHDGFNLNVGYFTNPSGVEIQDDEVPYFPDYTFGGILPGMNRTEFVNLFGN